MSECEKCFHYEVCDRSSQQIWLALYRKKCPDFMGWISVSERLPAETGMYRVCHKSKVVADRYFYSDAPELFAQFGNDPVTHWKPIEEPPKEDE